jgi:type IV pilus assembly protein PilV
MRLQHGFSLVEVLVTLLILKIGLLGVLAAQTLSLRQLHDAVQRTQAVAVTNSIFSELQANRQLAASIGAQLNLHAELPADPVCTAPLSCNAAQMATAQLYNMLAYLQPSAGSRLHDPALCLQQHASGLSVSISWQQRAALPERAQPCQASAGRSAFAVQGGGW